MDINKAFEEFIEKEWHDGHEPQGIDDQYVEEMEDGEEVDEKKALKLRDLNVYAAPKKKGKKVGGSTAARPMAFGISRKGGSGPGKGYGSAKKAPIMMGDEVETEDKTYLKVDLKKLKKQYEKNEDQNKHTENYLLLAKAFGTSAEVKKVQEIMKRNAKEGSTSKSDNDWMYKNINPYYDKIRNEETMKKEEVTLGDQLDQIVEDAEIDDIKESLGLQMKMAFDDAKIKVKGAKDGKLVVDKKDKKKAEDVISKQMKKPADAKRVLGSQIVFEEPEKTISKLFSHVRKLMSK